ncbi:MAG: rod shape-determining protein MreC [Sphingobacteriaceae bacterium]|nr:MAG: rod shape-determining protein MreC [Sphingobacteriaceae bacterium]
MRNLLIFITKYNAFFLFLIFEVSALVIYIKYNSFQKATFINSTNQVSAGLYEKASELKSYLSLREVNDSLALENARLRNQLKLSFLVDTVTKKPIIDTIYKQQYTHILAKVISNSVNTRNNYLTINMGSRAGIGKGMGVTSSSGVVGIVEHVGPHYSIVRSLLHKQTIISAMIARTKDRGSFKWGEDLDPTTGLLYDVSNNAQPKIGDMVVTSDASLFPAGIPIGKISNLQSKKGGGFFLNMDVKLSVDFSKLEYVTVIYNKLALEQAGLEALEKKDE